VRFQDLRDEKIALFFQVPEQKMHNYSFILNLFYTQFFNFAMQSLDNTKMPIYTLLDEFGHQTIPHFSSIITTIRKYKVSISIILQSISQLEAKY
jgi:type IV secretion system protein VirD4